MGLGPVEIARRVGINSNGVPYILEKYQETGSVHDLEKSGRKRKLSTKEIKQIVKKTKKKKCVPQIASELNNKVSARTNIKESRAILWESKEN